MAEATAAAAEVDATRQSWEELVAAYQKGQMAAPAMQFGGMPFGMPFAQPYMFPPAMLFPGMAGFNPAAAFAMPSGADGAAEAKATENGTSDLKTDATEDGEDEAAPAKQESEGPRTRKRGGLARATSAPSGKKARGESGGGMGVKSNSSAALAMLAGAAAGKNAAGTQAAAQGAAAAATTPAGGSAGGDAWTGGPAGSGGPAQVASVSDMQRLASDQAQFAGVTDERELKRLRRKQSNRESARRSRLRKQAECEALGQQVKDLITENSKLKEERLQLVAQIEILNAKLSMSTFGAVHALGQGELEKIQAELRKQTEAQQASMAAALAQVNATMAANGEKESQSDGDD